MPPRYYPQAPEGKMRTFGRWKLAGFVQKLLGARRMYDTFAHIGVAYQQDTGKGLTELLDVMGLSIHERRNLVVELDGEFGNSIASGNPLHRAAAIEEAIELLMDLLMTKRPDLAEATR